VRSVPVGVALALVAVVSLSGRVFPAEPQRETRFRFVNLSNDAGILGHTTNGDLTRDWIIDTLGSGAALLDFDGDGDTDIYVANGSMVEGIVPGKEPLPYLYRNDGNEKFTDVAAAAGLAVPFWGFGVTAADYDNDGDPDLYVTAWGPNHLYRNNGDGTFTDVSREAGVDDDRYGASTAFLDYDHDGLLDLYVTNYVTFDPAKIPRRADPNSPCTFRGLTVMCGPHGLPGAVDVLYHNNGDGTFTDVSRQAGILAEGGWFGLGVATADIDGDGWTDILVANDSTPNQFYRNQHDGTFVDDGLMSGFAYSNDGREQAGMGIETADIDQDGDLDIFVTNFSHDYCTLNLNDGKGFLEDVSVRVGLVEPTVRFLGWGTALFDAENDGDIDIFIGNGHVYPQVEEADIGTSYMQRKQLFENRGNLTFVEVEPDGGAISQPGLSRGVAAGDIDGDGDIDLFVTNNNGQPDLIMNESKSGAWLGVRLVGTASNREGLGARVTVKAAGKKWMAERRGGGSFLSSGDPVVHFGLGTAERVDQVEIRWPSGRTQIIESPALNQVITALEPGGSSGGAPAAKSASGKNNPS